MLSIMTWLLAWCRYDYSGYGASSGKVNTPSLDLKVVAMPCPVSPGFLVPAHVNKTAAQCDVAQAPL
jgi:hypothetical protein